MQKVFENCYALDKKCYEQYGLTEDILMEHAASGIANYIRKHFAEGSWQVSVTMVQMAQFLQGTCMVIMM